MLLQPPQGSEKKPDFTTVPQDIRHQLEQLCGHAIVSAETAYGGLSSSAGFILTLQDGAKLFAKGTHPDEMAHGTANLLQEIETYQNIPVLKKVSPRYIGKVWDGDEDGWMLGVWEYIEHDPARASWPQMLSCIRDWQQDQAAATALPHARDHNYISLFFSAEKKWQRLRDEQKTKEKFLTLFEDAAAAENWLQRSLPALCAEQRRANEAQGKEVLLHGDLRRDNFLFARDRAYVIDWPNACRGPAEFDLSFLCANLEALGAGRCLDLLRQANADMGAAVPVMAAMSGYFADQAYRAVPDKMPRLRWMQKAMLLSLLNTLSGLGIIESPPKMGGQNQ